MLRRKFRSLLNAGIYFVARHPAIHALVKIAYPFLPGLQIFLRRFLPRPAVVVLQLADVEAMLVFDRSRLATGPDDIVTVEQLVLLSRTI